VGAVRPALALVAALLGVVVLSSSANGAESAPAGGPRVTMFGDSIADSLNYVPDARKLLGDGVDLRLELSPCRKLVPVGCAYNGSRPPSVLDIVKSSTLAQLGNIVIVAVGYNDPANNYETDMATVANALVDRGVGHIIWVTLRVQKDDYRQINEIINAQTSRWPELRVADWEAWSRGKDWFNPDGLHLNADGAVGLATLLRPFVLTACGSACEAAGAKAPHNVRLPGLRGTPEVGRTLTCRPGAWTGTGPIVFSYRWLRGTRVLTHAVGSTHVLGRSDRGRTIACRVWAGNASGATAATSNPVRVRPTP
jgi:hypothetical protein